MEIIMTRIVNQIKSTEDRANFVDTILATATHKYATLADTNYTTCVTTFADGWSQIGSSVCVSSTDFNPIVGQSIARANAMAEAETHYWRVSGYMAMIGLTAISYDPQ
jgi:hypothetical protein